MVLLRNDHLTSLKGVVIGKDFHNLSATGIHLGCILSVLYFDGPGLILKSSLLSFIISCNELSISIEITVAYTFVNSLHLNTMHKPSLNLESVFGSIYLSILYSAYLL